MNARKYRLLAVAYARSLWPLLVDERSRRAVEAAERAADGQVSLEELAQAEQEASQAAQEAEARASGIQTDSQGEAASVPSWAVALAAQVAAVAALTEPWDAHDLVEDHLETLFGDGGGNAPSREPG